MSKNNLVDQFKTYDLRNKETDTLILCTGNISHIIHQHGVIIETEECYDEETRYDDSDTLFDNSIVISLGALDRRYEMVKKVRPEGFVSKSCSAKDVQFEIEIADFLEKNSDNIKTPKMRRLVAEGGITVCDDSGGDLFDLIEPAKLIENTIEVVKRIDISFELLKRLNKHSYLTEELFDSIREEMRGLGCEHYTFEHPSGGYDLKRYIKFGNTVELRAFGLKQKD